MKVLLTGATGYLGARVASRLVAAGHEVAALVRPGAAARVPSGVAALPGDLSDPISLKSALRGREGLVHMAALVRNWSRDPRDFDRVNVEGLALLLRATEESRLERIVYTSTIVALGPTDGAVRDETGERTDFRFRTDYERTKWLADRMVREKAAAGLPIIVVYPGVIYGPGGKTEGNLLRRTFEDTLARRLRFRLGRGDLRICYAFIEDVAEGHRLALERGLSGGGYILGGENATQTELFGMLEQLTGVPPPRWSLPYAPAEAAGWVMRQLARITGRPPLFTEGVVGTFRHEWAYSSRRAETDLGYRITPLRDGLRRTLESLRGGA
ncbi:MAG TPA: NAD-dependent epimerase/dehydratase family protein [Candidatus Polarisedimenticolia bacterium]